MGLTIRFAGAALGLVLAAACARHAFAGSYGDRRAGRALVRPTAEADGVRPDALPRVDSGAMLALDLEVRSDRAFADLVRRATPELRGLIAEHRKRVAAEARAEAAAHGKAVAKALAEGAPPPPPLELLPRKPLTVKEAQALLATPGLLVDPAPAAVPSGGGPERPGRERLAELLAAAARRIEANALVDDVEQLEAVATAIFAMAGKAEALAAQAAAVDARAARVVGELAGAREERRFLDLSFLTDAGIFVQRSFRPEGKPLGALVSLDRDLKTEKDDFSAIFCVGWQSEFVAAGRAGSVAVAPVVALHGQLLSAKRDRQNWWSVTAGVDAVLDLAPEANRGFTDRHSARLEAYLGGTFSRSQDGSIEDYGVRAELTPYWGAAWLNVRRGHENIDYATGQGIRDGCCAVPDNAVSFAWNFSTTLDAGWRSERQAGGGRSEATEVVGRVVVGATLFLDGLGRFLSNSPWDEKSFPFLEGHVTAWLFSQGADAVRTSWEVNFVVPVGKTIRFEAAYHEGVDELSFDDTETLHVGVAFLL